MKARISFWLRNVVLTCVILLAARSVDAQTVWKDGAGDWFESANWSDGVPHSSYEAQINNGGTAQISSTNANTNDLYLGFAPADSGNVLISGSYSLNNSNFLVVGHGGNGMITVQNGATLSDAFGNVGNLPGSDGAVLVESPGSIWTTGAYLNIGYSGNGTLTIRNGGLVSTFLGFIGWNPGSYGAVLVDGVGSTLTGSLSLGESGRADVTIQNGGTIAGTGVVNIGRYLGHGEVLVDGPGSSLTSGGRVNVGDDGGGRLTIRNGATVSGEEGYIGRVTGGDGLAVVDGVGSTWIAPYLEVGGYGTGSLTIQNGGTVLSGSGAGGGHVLIDGTGSNWTVANALSIGNVTIQNRGTVSSGGASVGGNGIVDGLGSAWFSHGQFTVAGSPGHLIIRNEGKVDLFGPAQIGSLSGYSGVITVDGLGSTLQSGADRIVVGYFAPGTLNIINDGLVSSFAVDVGVRSNGNIIVDGSLSALITGALLIGGGDNGGGPESIGVGQIDITNQASVRTVSTTIFERGTINNNGFLSSYAIAIEGGLLGGGGYTHSDVTNGGRLIVGDPIGPAEIVGDYTQLANGELTLDVAGTDPVASDHLEIQGNVNLDGLLTVRFVNGFLPLNGQSFRLLRIINGASTGAFARIAFPDLRNGFQFQTELLDGDYQITALNDGTAATGFLNISTRMEVGAGDNTLIGGFIATGTEPKRVIIRAIGPSLTVGERLLDPTLELRDSAGALLRSNDNWMESDQVQEIIDSGIAPTDPNESAIVATLVPGAYTAVMRGNGANGIGVVEVYDLAPDVASKLANVSTRGLVQTGDKVMIGGFIADNQAMRVMVRAIGPSLSPDVPDALADPMLELFDGQGAMIAANDDWEQANAGAIAGSGIAPLNEKESAIFATLSPGPYTAIVRGKSETIGVGLVEVYDLP